MTPEQTLGKARDLLQSGKLPEAIRLLESMPASAPALHLLAQIAYQQGDLPGAISRLQAAVRADPDATGLHNDLGNLHQMAGALEPAVESYQNALRLHPDYAEAYRNMASALRRLGRFDEAVVALESAVSLNPNFAEAIAQLVHQLKQRCDWRSIDALTARLIDAVSANSAPVNPFVFICLETTPAQRLQCARQWADALFPAHPAPPPLPPREKITVGYLSADFQEHATAHLSGEIFVLHDRSRFRIIGYSYGKDDGSLMRRSLTESFDSFVDLETASHADAAARIRQDKVDILVDLKGYTTDARPEILALRPAPVQASYLGFPGTAGSTALDYILVDPFVVPTDQQPYYTERVVHLPNCYMPNDRRRPIASPAPTRAASGLPDSAFVFCCLSVAYKITPRIFDIWMRLLARVPGSVLWLFDSGPAAAANLRREAEARLAGGAARLVFAPSIPNAQHLARIPQADLFLDTLPYNAHTLAIDALWSGVPMVTCVGETFPSRVAGSILRTIGLPELVTTTLEDYEALALQLANDAALLQSIRAKLQTNRLTTPLFDTALFTRNLEAAFVSMYKSC